MKNAVLFLISLFFLLTACQDQNSVVAPSNNANNLEWVTMPTGLKSASGLQTETTFLVTELIEGKKGGKLKSKIELVTPDGQEFEIKAELKVPKHAFDDLTTMLFTMEIDQNNTVTGFSPTPFTFDVPLEYEIEYKGLDVSNLTLENLSFAYIAGDGTLQLTDFEKIELDHGKRKIKVKKARIPHFSRFGFVKIQN